MNSTEQMSTKLLAYGDINKIVFLTVTVLPETGWSNVERGSGHREHSLWEKKAENELRGLCDSEQGRCGLRFRQGSGLGKTTLYMPVAVAGCLPVPAPGRA